MRKITKKILSLVAVLSALFMVGAQCVFADTGIVVTGDNTNLKPIIGIIAIAVVGLIIVLVKKKK